MNALKLSDLYRDHPEEANAQIFLELERRGKIAPGLSVEMASRLQTFHASGTVPAILGVCEFSSPKEAGDTRRDAPAPCACSLYHPRFVEAMDGDRDGLCAGCRSEAESLRMAQIEADWKATRRRQKLAGLLTLSLPEWLYTGTVLICYAALLFAFAWGVGR